MKLFQSTCLIFIVSKLIVIFVYSYNAIKKLKFFKVVLGMSFNYTNTLGCFKCNQLSRNLSHVSVFCCIICEEQMKN